MQTQQPITYPAPEEYSGLIANYVQQAKTENLLEGLTASYLFITGLVQGLSEEQLHYRYAPGKWSIKELLVHMIDAERIFTYRALRFARQDKTELPGFDEGAYTQAAKADARDINSIIAEYTSLRTATIELFKSFDAEALNQRGVASGLEVSVRALGFVILGHEVHHQKIMRERYLV
ncbi:DinB family protein [Pontibacter akesuensis]|uniref:DinB superfamily protein n=1 Tax=Pontibacter akesuensis TaxID=388950 RepID=A0A1I7H314_9BACT|nr:DinB family protein [Pontibacter akesuensis]GHA53729.1 DNA damage-inducible protein DinB [Pontibacter akesuensis]SFU55084.1 DinB superfamily protein [Pontibacter akesuensis]